MSNPTLMFFAVTANENSLEPGYGTMKYNPRLILVNFGCCCHHQPFLSTLASGDNDPATLLEQQLITNHINTSSPERGAECNWAKSHFENVSRRGG